MAKEYGIWENNRIISCTDGFDENDVTQTIDLSDGKKLLISGKDEQMEELKKLLSESEDANAAKEVFLSSMSHDIRTPMNAIVGMTALAKKHIDEKNKVSDSLNKIEVASDHLLNLINEVLDMSRINSGKIVVNEEPFFISDLLHETLIIARPQAESKNHNLIFSTDNIEIENLIGDPLRLRQIFVNIINNSVKYTNEGGTIKVKISEEVSDGICNLIFTCEDNGQGMSEEFLKKLFDPFERANTTTISKVEGTGLGMSIVKKLIDAMNGTIEVESEINKGTKVTVNVPMAFERINLDTSTLIDKKILILEAKENIQKIYRRYLDEFELQYKIVNNSSEMIAALSQAAFTNNNYDIVVIGTINEKTGDIFTIASYIHKANAQMPIVLISEDNYEEIEYRANRSGIRDFIPIPFFRKSLINGLSRALTDTDENIDSTPDLSKMKILLVEDNMINREIIKEILSSTHADIDTAENGKEGYEKFMNNDYDLIFMDIQMPVMDGYEATRMIRSSAKETGSTIKIYAMTANTFAEDIAKAKEAGMDGHISKPIDVNKVMSLLRSLC